MSATKSIQGERQQDVSERQYADQAFVDELASKVSDAVATCRARGRHNYPPISAGRLNFDHIRQDGLLERRTGWCADCGCVRQVQVWEPYQVTVARRRVSRVRPLFNYPEYDENEQGETYLVKGHGKVAPKAFADARATQALAFDQEAYEMVAAALRQQRKNERGES